MSSLSIAELNSINERAELLISECLGGRAWRRGAEEIQRALHADLEYSAHVDSSARFSERHKALVDRFSEPAAPNMRYARALLQTEIVEVVRRGLKLDKRRLESVK